MFAGSTGATLAIILLVTAAPSTAQDRVLGLLSLPEVFGKGPCHQFEPAAVALHQAPGAAPTVGSIQVDQHWSFAPHGGCDGLKVSVHGRGTRSESANARVCQRVAGRYRAC